MGVSEGHILPAVFVAVHVSSITCIRRPVWQSISDDIPKRKEEGRRRKEEGGMKEEGTMIEIRIQSDRLDLYSPSLFSPSLLSLSLLSLSSPSLSPFSRSSRLLTSAS